MAARGHCLSRGRLLGLTAGHAGCLRQPIAAWSGGVHMVSHNLATMPSLPSGHAHQTPLLLLSITSCCCSPCEYQGLLPVCGQRPDVIGVCGTPLAVSAMPMSLSPWLCSAMAFPRLGLSMTLRKFAFCLQAQPCQGGRRVASTTCQPGSLTTLH